MLPPLTRSPPLSAGKPTSSAIQRTVWASISLATGESGQPPRFGLTAAASRSASAPMGAADDVMYPQKRGWPLKSEWSNEKPGGFCQELPRVAPACGHSAHRQEGANLGHPLARCNGPLR